MATSPDAVRSGLLLIASEAQADVRAVAQAAGDDPSDIRAALFAATPLLVATYGEGSTELGLEWFEDVRLSAGVRSAFTPQPFLTVDDDQIAAMVAQATESLHQIEQGIARELESAMAESLALLEAEIEQELADAFRETVTENAKNDPDAVGWRRFARPEACKFCTMLAARGAVYTEETARFAAHGAVMSGDRKGGNCMCIAGPAYGGKETWAEATPMQYMASRSERTPAQRARLREYLNTNFPDAPG